MQLKLYQASDVRTNWIGICSIILPSPVELYTFTSFDLLPADSFVIIVVQESYTMKQQLIDYCTSKNIGFLLLIEGENEVSTYMVGDTQHEQISSTATLNELNMVIRKKIKPFITL